VIGSGGAGLRCAIELKDKGVDVLIVGKCKKRDAHTVLATGGINAVLGNRNKEDSWQLHAADTIRDGGGINDMRAVEILCKNAPKAVRELERWGANFNKEKNGKISQRFFGAATYQRACFVGDHTGKAILNTLVNQVVKRKIKFRGEIYIVNLLTAKNGKVNGAIGFDIRKGELICFHCKCVVLCTGGHSRVFKRSSSRFWENNGDGIYLGYELGARFMDMEMFQFHPTGMVYPKGAEGVLVTEAVRGEGGILTNSKGERFMKNYDKKRMELSARDVVARANYWEIKRGRETKHKGVWLDISHKPKSYILKRLPKIYKQFKEYANIDISKEKMEVAPTAHYSMGGIFVSHGSGKTSIPGLFAIGEVTAGVHGGNRLGGNSLAEICVFGKLIGKSVIKEVKKIKESPLDEELISRRIEEFEELARRKKGRNSVEVKSKIQEIMWEYAWVVRNGRDLKKGLGELEKFKKVKLKVGKSLKMNEKLIAALDVRNMIPTGEMILLSALARKESRAAHYRSDFPKENKKWKKNIVCETKGGNIKLGTRRVERVPREIARFLEREIKDGRERHMLE
jgi:succinate dehydrogenase / fumarate reductase, flavoprotein subunit